VTYREVFDNPVLDVVETIMVSIEYGTGLIDIERTARRTSCMAIPTTARRSRWQ
jgi:hypothetical protein